MAEVHSMRCSQCGLNYPTSYPGRCVECDGALARMADAEPMTEDEFKQRRAFARLRRGDAPATLTTADYCALHDDLANFQSLYDDLMAEAQRRGPRWSPADILEERSQRREAA